MIVEKTQKVELKPKLFMRNYLDAACNYRRYCWNSGLAVWQDMYYCRRFFLPPGLKNTLKWNVYHPRKQRQLSFFEQTLCDGIPAANGRNVRDYLVSQKENWQQYFSARILQLACTDLDNAWHNFFNKSQPDWGKPKFKKKKDKTQSFKTDRARIQDGKLLMDKPKGISAKLWQAIPMYEKPKMNGKLKLVVVIKQDNHYYACLTYKVNVPELPKTGKSVGIDVNVRLYAISGQKPFAVLPERLNKLYKRIKYYQRRLAKKRNVSVGNVNSHNYLTMKTKLQCNYQKATNIQKDAMQKLTTALVKANDHIIIEDLDVKHMKMKHVASKGLHRAMFGKFKQYLKDKCYWYGKDLILADRLYPSTQRCSRCGWVKRGVHKLGLAGNKADGEDHDTFICQHCGLIINRDYNACLNLLAYPQLQKNEPEYLNRICTTQAMA